MSSLCVSVALVYLALADALIAPLECTWLRPAVSHTSHHTPSASLQPLALHRHSCSSVVLPWFVLFCTATCSLMQRSTLRLVGSYSLLIHSLFMYITTHPLQELIVEAVACSRWHCVRGCVHTHTDKLLTFNLTCICLDGGRKYPGGNCRDTGRTCKLCPERYLPGQPSCYDATLNRCLRLSLVVTSRAGS